MVDCASFLKEAKVLDAEGLRSTFFFWAICSNIFAIPHCEEESADAELCNRNVIDGGVVIDELA